MINNLTNNSTEKKYPAGLMAGFNREEDQEQHPFGVGGGVNTNLPLCFAFGSLNNVAFGASGSRGNSSTGGKVVRGGCSGGAEVAERRHRRKIKNRESAARSRARKLAYNIQQQVEIKELKKENEFLRKTIKILSTNLAPKEIGDEKPSLKRSFSGPL